MVLAAGWGSPSWDASQVRLPGPGTLSTKHKTAGFLTRPLYCLQGDRRDEVRSVGQSAVQCLGGRHPEGAGPGQLLPLVAKVISLAPSSLHEGILRAGGCGGGGDLLWEGPYAPVLSTSRAPLTLRPDQPAPQASGGLAALC